MLGFSGCGHFELFKDKASVTAVPLSAQNQHEPHGIPYYLPKPLLVIAKNVRHIESSKPGLTAPPPIPNAFDNQAQYGDIKANVSMPSGGEPVTDDQPDETREVGDVAAPFQHDVNESVLDNTNLNDGLDGPKVYYTYQIVFVPDLSQKYGLRISGGPGEIRAAMNLVNGWMYTGMGPYYMKDSSTAQNMMACGVGAMYAGRGIADVVGEVNKLQRAGGGGGGNGNYSIDSHKAKAICDACEGIIRASKSGECLKCIPNYAEIAIYEPVLTDCGQTEWRQIAHHSFDRHYNSAAGPADPAAYQVVQQILQQQASAPEPPQACAEVSDNGLFEAASRDALRIPQVSTPVNSYEMRADGEPVQSAGVVAIQQNAPSCPPSACKKGPCFPNIFRKDRTRPQLSSRVTVIRDDAICSNTDPGFRGCAPSPAETAIPCESTDAPIAPTTGDSPQPTPDSSPSLGAASGN
jgi:hypothetical protein